MNNDWEGTEYTVCPHCKQIVTRESLENCTYIYQDRSDFIRQSSLPCV